MAAPASAAGYATGRERGALVVALPSVIQHVQSQIREHGTLYDAAASRPGAEAFAGRGAAYRYVSELGDWVVRHYRRGGAVAHVLKDEYLRAGEPRPLRELHASIAARARGVDTPEVVAAVVYLAGPLYRADLATRYVPDSRDLAAATIENDEATATEREAAWSAAGSIVRRAFAAGIEHADLNLRNILIAGPAQSPRALLLDLDRAIVRERAVTDAARHAIIERMHRSRAKLEAGAGRVATAAELEAFDSALRGFGG